MRIGIDISVNPCYYVFIQLMHQ